MKAVEGYRNFATKLWNAARFAEMNECVRQQGFDPKAVEQTVNRWIAGEVERTARRRHRRHRGLQVQRGGRRDLRVRLGHVLRLVPGADQAGARRRRRGREGRDARHHRLGARPDPEAAASVHAVHHRGAVGPRRRGRDEARDAAVPQRLAGVRGARRRGCRRGDRLAHQAGQRGALGAVGDERSRRRQDPAGAGRLPASRRAPAPSGTRTPSSGWRGSMPSAFAKTPPKGSAQIVLDDDHGGAAACRRDRHGRRARAGSSARSTRRRRRSPRSMPSSPTPTSSPRRRPRWWRRTASARPLSRRPCASCRRRSSAWKRPDAGQRVNRPLPAIALKGVLSEVGPSCRERRVGRHAIGELWQGFPVPSPRAARRAFVLPLCGVR